MRHYIIAGLMCFMFYAGTYNNRPQQIGVAGSSDGIHWTKLSNKPFLVNGHPFITHYKNQNAN